MVALYYVQKNALFHLMFDAWEGLYRSLDIDLHQVLISKKIFAPERSQVSHTTTSNIANSADQDSSLVMMSFNAHCTVHSAPKDVNVNFANHDPKSVQYHTMLSAYPIQCPHCPVITCWSPDMTSIFQDLSEIAHNKCPRLTEIVYTVDTYVRTRTHMHAYSMDNRRLCEVRVWRVADDLA